MWQIWPLTRAVRLAVRRTARLAVRRCSPSRLAARLTVRLAARLCGRSSPGCWCRGRTTTGRRF
eukprot:5257108-Pyramimonas_sp.AAC.1